MRPAARGLGSNSKTKFQSSSDPKAGCDDYVKVYYRQPSVSILICAMRRLTTSNIEVSILIRPEGRMRLRRETFPLQKSFNPHPTRRPDATATFVTTRGVDCVSILIRPEGRMRPGEPSGKEWSSDVSILIRPEGRMRPRTLAAGGGVVIEFQSSSDPKAGCDQSSALGPAPSSRFQSSSDPKAGCDTTTGVRRCNSAMFQSSSDPKAGCDVWLTLAAYNSSMSFNPHPTRRPDATSLRRLARHLHQGFNPHPTRRPYATRARRPWRPDRGSFNPHPTRRPYATLPVAVKGGGGLGFQSSSDPKAVCDARSTTVAARSRKFQSSSDPKAGCDWWAKEYGWRWVFVSILIRPEGRMRPDSDDSDAAFKQWFQSSSDPKAGCDATKQHVAIYQM